MLEPQSLCDWYSVDCFYVTTAGWQVTLCDPIRYVISGVVISITNCCTLTFYLSLIQKIMTAASQYLQHLVLLMDQLSSTDCLMSTVDSRRLNLCWSSLLVCFCFMCNFIKQILQLYILTAVVEVTEGERVGLESASTGGQMIQSKIFFINSI